MKLVPLLVLASPLLAAVGCGLFVLHKKSQMASRRISLRDILAYQFRWIVVGYSGAIAVSVALATLSDNPRASLIFFVCVPVGMALGEVAGTIAWTRRRD